MHDLPPLAVRRYGIGTYLVRSQRPACSNCYVVDLGDRRFVRGRCACIDYDVRIEAPIKRGEVPERWTCIHIDAANSELEHARQLCELAGLPFSENIIPSA